MTKPPAASAAPSGLPGNPAKDTTPDRSLVSVRGLAKAFGDHQVLTSIDFEVPVGTVTVLIGPSGSGKTTVLRSLNVLETPDAGVIRIGEVESDFSTDVTRKQAEALRAQSGMVFQAHNLFPHMTVLQNITAGPILVQGRQRADAEHDAMELLRIVGLSEKADQYPYQLSGGQQQRVGIARALAIRPKLMLFDEPTSSLDPELVGEVLEAMKDLATQGWTMVVVTHEIRFAQQVADQVLFLDDGIIVERGTPAQVLTAPSSERARQFLHRLLDPL
jgi:cystine transport system ATP-binding protein